MSLLKSLQLVGRINKDAISFIGVNVNVDIGSRHSLQGGVRAITEDVEKRDGHILLGDIIVRHSGEHQRVVVLLLGVLVLQADNLEALTAHIASVDGAFSDKVEHLFVGVRVVLNTRARADDDSPGAVGGEDENGVVDSTELRVDDGLHFVPLIELERVLCNIGAERGSGVAVSPIALGELGLVVNAIWLHKALDMSPGLIKSVAHFVNK
jgi:hypothetical protein